MVEEDPTIARVRAARRKILDECGGDMHELFERARRWQIAHPERVVGYETDRKGAPE